MKKQERVERANAILKEIEEDETESTNLDAQAIAEAREREKAQEDFLHRPIIGRASDRVEPAQAKSVSCTDKDAWNEALDELKRSMTPVPREDQPETVYQEPQQKKSWREQIVYVIRYWSTQFFIRQYKFLKWREKRITEKQIDVAIKISKMELLILTNKHNTSEWHRYLRQRLDKIHECSPWSVKNGYTKVTTGGRK